MALCAKMKAECEVVTSDWDGIIPALNAKKFDFIVSSLSITDERKQAVDFTDPYYSNKQQFMAKEGRLQNRHRLPQRQINSAPSVRPRPPPGWKTNSVVTTAKLYDTQENAYLDLTSGRLDAMLADKYANTTG
jgi:putative lysine/arginine/ornithine/histidine/octopine transport system substrate-binding protein